MATSFNYHETYHQNWTMTIIKNGLNCDKSDFVKVTSALTKGMQKRDIILAFMQVKANSTALEECVAEVIGSDSRKDIFNNIPLLVACH